MGTGWRRAFCTTVQREGESMAPDNSTPRPIKTRSKLGLFSSNPSTPRFGAQAAPNDAVSAGNTPRLRTPTSPPRFGSQAAPNDVVSAGNTPRLRTPSPRSPFSILKSSLRLSKVGHGGCGVCLQRLKKGQRMAIYTADCSHSFHFQCIAQHVKKQGNLICPVCNRLWTDVPLLSVHCRRQNEVVEKNVTSPAHVRTKPYNDDEPLISPTAGAKFNPIPEAEDENDDDDVEEFKGFFVNSTPSTPTLKSHTTGYVRSRQTHRSVEVRLQPEAAVVTASRSHETFTVAIKVKAPPPPMPPVFAAGHRAPVDLVTVLDVGGSMNSTKLQMLKRAMRLVISSLGSADRLCIVAFSGAPARLLPLRRMTHNGQRLARHIIDNLNLAAGDGKSVGAAMKTAAQVLEDRREKNPVATIILLSDGQDNNHTPKSSEANQRQPRRHAASPRFGHVEIPIHHGGGGDAFAKRVGSLLSVVVQDLRLELGFSAGSAPGEISAVYSSDGRPRLFGADSIRLGDLYAEEERELLVEIRVPTSASGAHHVMSVRCSYRDPPTGEVMYGRERALLVPRPRTARAAEPRVERLRNIFLATRAVAEARRLVEQGELGCAERLLESAKALVAQSCSASAEEYVGWLAAELTALRWQRRRKGEDRVAFVDENGEPLTPTSAWRAAEQLAKVAAMKKSLNRGSDLLGFENARF